MESPREKSPLTESQLKAVRARGNVLVMAGAGTGKTRTLVARCLDCLERDRVALDELLVVTFTEAAAAEMRLRLRKSLEEKITARPEDAHWQEQMARFDLAHIGTLHGFCFKLVREHFYKLGLDPQLAVLDEGEARQLANETLEEQFQSHYEGGDEFSLAVQNLIQIHGGGRDEKIRALILRLHHYSQSRPDAAGWLAEQIRRFSTTEPTDWRRWLIAVIQDWRDEWLPVLENLGAPISRSASCSPGNERAEREFGAPAANEKAVELAGIFSRLGGAGVAPAKSGIAPDFPPDEGVRRDAGHNRPEACSTNISRELAAEVLEQIVSADGNWPAKRKTTLRKPLEDLFDEAKFLVSLAAVKNGGDPLAEDWAWVHGQMETLLRLAREFAEQFAGRKRADGVLDFHDLEQFALKLLWDFSADKPTAVAETWRAKLKFIFVDEYQDINAAQDKIISALSRRTGVAPVSSFPGPLEAEPKDGDRRDAGPTQGNRFLVGDVKQSIYRFRLADPKIFRDYAQNWRGKSGETIPLAENFRSRESLLHFVNSVFRLIMREEIGGVNYDGAAELKFGSPATRANVSESKDSGPRAELLLRLKKGRHDDSESENGGELAGLEESEKEARMLALRLRELKNPEHKIWDEEQKMFRAVEWRDMAVLLRSPRGKSEAYAKEFERAGVPSRVERGGFYDSSEVLDLLSLLKLLDNPLQDVPCIAVLHSPLVGLSLDELAEIRLAARDVHFWTALNHWGKAESGKRKAESLSAKIEKFLERFSRWRKLAKQISLSQCLEEVLAETLYADWLRARPRGAQRAANVGRFLQLAQQFDQFQRQGLFRFLKFIEAQQEAEVEPEVPAAAAENAVRLMSIHQSKGLEFPVVVVADLAKPFNEQDLRGEIIFDEEFGLCPKVKPPANGRRYPSLTHWLARRRQKRELRGEELRLLYVAMTRARDTLILSASVTEKNWDEKWARSQPVTTQNIAGAKNFADWLAIWFGARSVIGSAGETKGEFPELRWRILDDTEPTNTVESEKPEVKIESPAFDEKTKKRLQKTLEWRYAFDTATKRKAKSSVTELRREADEWDDEAEPIFVRPRLAAKEQKRKAEGGEKKLSAAEAGVAHHKFLQHVALDKTGDPEAEAERLAREHILSADERAALDWDALAAFWNSDLGQKICAKAASVRRELPFTARFSPAEIGEITGRKAEAELENEFIVVQGIADLVVLLPREIWLVDFKTDAVTTRELPDKIKTYAPQLKLYAAALEKIFARKVTLRALHFLSAQRTEKI